MICWQGPIFVNAPLAAKKTFAVMFVGLIAVPFVFFALFYAPALELKNIANMCIIANGLDGFNDVPEMTLMRSWCVQKPFNKIPPSFATSDAFFLTHHWPRTTLCPIICQRDSFQGNRELATEYYCDSCWVNSFL